VGEKVTGDQAQSKVSLKKKVIFGTEQKWWAKEGRGRENEAGLKRLNRVTHIRNKQGTGGEGPSLVKNAWSGTTRLLSSNLRSR